MIKSLQFIILALLLSGFSNAKFAELLKNTEIDVVAPASGADNNTLKTLKNISSLKLNIPNHCFVTTKELFHSNSDEVRGECLKEALFNESNNIVWALRGGYGSAKLIPYLQKLPKPDKAKFFIGYSDITALHIFLSQEWGWKPIHGSNISELLKNDKECKNFTRIAEIVNGKNKQASINKLSAINDPAKSSKSVTGKLTGGNLEIVRTTIGTNWQIKTAGKILFLEEVNITAYQLDRSLLHLQQANLLKDVKAIIFGNMGDDKYTPVVLNVFAQSLNIPVFKTDRFGHKKINDPIIYNTDSKIILNKDTDDFKLMMYSFNQ